MEDDVRLEALHHLEHPLRLPAIGEHGLDPGEVPFLEHLEVDPKQVVLSLVEQHQEPRPHASDLAAKLRSDRAAGARDHHDLVVQVGADPLQLHHHRLASEDVLDPDLAELAGELDVSAQQLEHGRQRAHRDLALPARRDHLGAQHAGRRRNRDDHLVRRLAVEDRADVVRRAQDLHPGRVHAPLAGIVVQEAHRAGAKARVQPHLAGHHLPARAGADDQHPAGAAASGAVGPLGDHPPGEPGAAHQDDGEQEVVDDHRPRKVVGVGLREREDRDQQPAGHGCGADDGPQVGKLEVAPPLLVQAEEAEHGRLAESDEDDRSGEHGPVAVRDATGRVEEAQVEGKGESGGGEQCIGTELQEPPAVDVIDRSPAHQGLQTAAPGPSPAFVLARRRVIEAGHSGECNADDA